MFDHSYNTVAVQKKQRRFKEWEGRTSLAPTPEPALLFTRTVAIDILARNSDAFAAAAAAAASPTGPARATPPQAATAPAAAPAAPPLAIAPAPAGSKALIVCREGAEEASVAEQWATRSRGGGATVSVCPPGYLDSHGKSNAGAYDSIVVEAWEGLPETALAEVGVCSCLLKAAAKRGGGREASLREVGALLFACMDFAASLKVWRVLASLYTEPARYMIRSRSF